MPVFQRIPALLATPIRWAWSRKRRTTGVTFALMLCIYSVLCVLVSCSRSPTDQQVTLTDGRVLAYNEYAAGEAQGPRVILLHGAPADAKSWNRLVDRRDELKVSELIAVDRIGYGNSTSEDELTLEGQAAAIAPLLKDVARNKPIIVGHSYGGPVALRLAVDYPDKVGGVILVAGACDANMQDSQWFRRAINGIRIIVPMDWERANRELLALTDENRAMEPMLGRVVCPVAIVHGTWDSVCPHDSTVAYLQDRLINAKTLTVESIPRARHNLQLNHVDAMIEAINHTARQEP